MHYKSVILELLQQLPQIQQQLRKERKLLSTVEQYANELRQSHQAWRQLLTQVRPDSTPSQLTSEAFEIALKEIQDRLPSDSPRDDNLFLDAAMLFLRRHPTSRG